MNIKDVPAKENSLAVKETAILGQSLTQTL